MATREDTWLATLTTVINAVGTPDLKVIAGHKPAPAMLVNDVQLVPLTMSHEPAGGGKQRWHLGVLVVLRSKLVAPTGSTSAWADVFAATRALLAAIDNAQSLRGGGSAGVEQTRRGAPQYWAMPDGATGAAAGSLMEVTADWAE